MEVVVGSVVRLRNAVNVLEEILMHPFIERRRRVDLIVDRSVKRQGLAHDFEYLEEHGFLIPVKFKLVLLHCL
jgi:hypothetical protein